MHAMERVERVTVSLDPERATRRLHTRRPGHLRSQQEAGPGAPWGPEEAMIARPRLLEL